MLLYVRVPIARVSRILAQDIRDAVARDVVVSIAKKDISQAIADVSFLSLILTLEINVERITGLLDVYRHYVGQ